MDEECSRGLTLLRILLVLFSFSLLIAPIADAQLGEIAGQLSFVVQVGHNQTLQLHLLNEGNRSIMVQVTAQHMQFSSNRTTQVNQTTPSIFIQPENVTVPAYGTAAVNITVLMPLTNKPNWAQWQDILSAQEVTNASNPGGALILQGVAKLVTVYAIPSTTTTSTIPTTVSTIAAQQAAPSALPPVALPIAIIIIIIVIAVAYYYSRAPKKRVAGKKKVKEEETREDIEKEIARLRREKARLQAQVKTAQRRKGAGRKKKTGTRKRTPRKGGAKPRTRARGRARPRRRRR